MAYNLIDFPQRRVFSVWLWRLGAATAVIMLLITIASFWLGILAQEKQLQLKKAQADESALQEQVAQLRHRILRLQSLNTDFTQVETANTLQMQQLRNLLDLVPDSTTLRRFAWDEETLILAGISRDKVETETTLDKGLSGQYRRQGAQWNGNAFVLTYGVSEETP